MIRTKVTIEGNFEFKNCDAGIAIAARLVEEIINYAKETNNPGKALAIVCDKLSELDLKPDFRCAGITLLETSE